MINKLNDEKMKKDQDWEILPSIFTSSKQTTRKYLACFSRTQKSELDKYEAWSHPTGQLDIQTRPKIVLNSHFQIEWNSVLWPDRTR